MASLTIDSVSVEVALLATEQTIVSWLTFTLDRLSCKLLGSGEVSSAVVTAAINWCVTIVAVFCIRRPSVG